MMLGSGQRNLSPQIGGWPYLMEEQTQAFGRGRIYICVGLANRCSGFSLTW